MKNRSMLWIHPGPGAWDQGHETGCFLLGLGGFALLRLSKWSSRDDVGEIRRQITELLEEGAS
jgi:hypothetical protein